MLATTATASATRGTQSSSPRDNSSTLIAEICSSFPRTRADTAAPLRTASTAPAGTYTVGVRPPTRGNTT